MKCLYVIPARGGSKGIPRKNIKRLAGRPLIGYTIDALDSIGVPHDRVILSTDSDEIAAVSRSLGLDVPYRRPASLATDTSGSREVILDAMQWAGNQGICYDCVVLLQPTSPLRTPDDILRTVEALDADKQADMAVTVCRSPHNPYYDIFETSADGSLHVSKGSGLITRRQDAPQVWIYNGAVYAIRPESIRRYPLGAMPRRIPVEMPAARSIDLDTPADWERAESLIQSINQNG